MRITHVVMYFMQMSYVFRFDCRWVTKLSRLMKQVNLPAFVAVAYVLDAFFKGEQYSRLRTVARLSVSVVRLSLTVIRLFMTSRVVVT